METVSPGPGRPFTPAQYPKTCAVLEKATVIERVAELLGAIEWEGDNVHYECPACKSPQRDGHKETCALALLMPEVLHLAGNAKAFRERLLGQREANV